jgi:hypothetical protein
MLRRPAGVLDMAEEPVELLGNLAIRAAVYRQRMQARRALFYLPGNVRHILPELVEYQTGARAAWVVFALPLYVRVPLLRIGRIGKR